MSGGLHSSLSAGYKLHSSARLKRRRLIEALFDRTRYDVHTIAHGSVRLIYRTLSRADIGHDVPVQVAFGTVRSSSVLRNRIKRLLRDVYRHHKREIVLPFLERPGALTLMILFRGDPVRDQVRIRNDLPKLLKTLHHLLTQPRVAPGETLMHPGTG